MSWRNKGQLTQSWTLDSFTAIPARNASSSPILPEERLLGARTSRGRIERVPPPGHRSAGIDNSVVDARSPGSAAKSIAGSPPRTTEVDHPVIFHVSGSTRMLPVPKSPWIRAGGMGHPPPPGRTSRSGGRRQPSVGRHVAVETISDPPNRSATPRADRTSRLAGRTCIRSAWRAAPAGNDRLSPERIEGLDRLISCRGFPAGWDSWNHGIAQKRSPYLRIAQRDEARLGYCHGQVEDELLRRMASSRSRPAMPILQRETEDDALIDDKYGIVLTIPQDRPRRGDGEIGISLPKVIQESRKPVGRSPSSHRLRSIFPSLWVRATHARILAEAPCIVQ